MTVRERIREYAESKGGAVSNRELVDVLHLHTATVRKTTSRMAQSGELVPSGDGSYLPATAAHTAHGNIEQGDERDSRETPAYTGGIGVYSHSTGGMIPWRPKSG